MFKFLKKRDKNNETSSKSGISTQNSDDIISAHEKEIDLIYTTLQLSRENFDAIYLTYIKNFSFFIQSIPCFNTKGYEKYHGLIHLSLLAGLNAIKKRRGFVLPPGTRTDIQELQRSVWSFVVFTSAVNTILKNHLLDAYIEVSNDNGKTFEKWCLFDLEPIGNYQLFRFKESTETNIDLKKPIAASFLFNQFISKEGLNWIKKYDDVFSEWCALCTNNSGNIRWLMDFSNESYFCPERGQSMNSEFESQPIEADIDSEEIHDTKAEVSPSIKEKIPAKEKVPSKITSKQNELSFKNNETNSNMSNSPKKSALRTQKGSTRKVVPKNKTPALNIDTEDGKKISDFLHWVIDGYNDGSLVLNTRQSVIHSVDSGIYLIIPTVFKAYGKSSALDDRAIKELEMIIMSDTDSGFIKNESNGNVHLYDGYGNNMKGFIASFALLNVFVKPPINSELRSKKASEDSFNDSF